jgi:hypothetical protein
MHNLLILLAVVSLKAFDVAVFSAHCIFAVFAAFGPRLAEAFVGVPRAVSQSFAVVFFTLFVSFHAFFHALGFFLYLSVMP